MRCRRYVSPAIRRPSGVPSLGSRQEKEGVQVENTEHTEGQGVNRRSFIKRAAATGGVVIFAAPAIQTVVAGAARATTPGGASAPPEGCFHSTGTNGGCMPTCTS